MNNEDELENEDDSSTEEVDNNYSLGSSNEASSPHFEEERVRRPPYWMKDYETGQSLSEDEDNLALFVVSVGHFILKKQ